MRCRLSRHNIGSVSRDPGLQRKWAQTSHQLRSQAAMNNNIEVSHLLTSLSVSIVPVLGNQAPLCPSATCFDCFCPDLTSTVIKFNYPPLTPVCVRVREYLFVLKKGTFVWRNIYVLMIVMTWHWHRVGSLWDHARYELWYGIIAISIPYLGPEILVDR